MPDGARSGDGNATPTLENVARIAGVSRATASRVVNGSTRVSPDAKRAVDRAVRRLGYQPNRAARSLVTRRTDSIALVIPEPTTKLFGDPFFPRLLRGVSETLAARDLQLVLVMPQSPDDEARAERYLGGGHVDGALLVSLHGNDPLPARLADRGVPTVVGGRPDGDAVVSYVDVDNVDGARRAVHHLIARGRRRIATISGPLDMVPGRDRRTGYRAALAGAGLDPSPRLEEEGDFTQESGTRAMRALLAREPSIDAVFAASDLMAIGALRALHAAGRAVPTDVAVVGYDDAPLAQMTDPPLTSVRQPIEEMGREMARLLVTQVQGAERVARRVILATQLVVRESSGGERG